MHLFLKRRRFAFAKPTTSFPLSNSHGWQPNHSHTPVRNGIFRWSAHQRVSLRVAGRLPDGGVRVFNRLSPVLGQDGKGQSLSGVHHQATTHQGPHLGELLARFHPRPHSFVLERNGRRHLIRNHHPTRHHRRNHAARRKNHRIRQAPRQQPSSISL